MGSGGKSRISVDSCALGPNTRSSRSSELCNPLASDLVTDRIPESPSESKTASKSGCKTASRNLVAVRSPWQLDSQSGLGDCLTTSE